MKTLGTFESSLLSRMRGLGRRPLLPWLLGVLFLAQALIPLQSHTRLEVNDQGIVVEVCTLDGVTSVVLHLNDQSPRQDGGDDEQRSPAMAFSQLMAEALLDLAAVQPTYISLAASIQPPAVIGTPSFSDSRLTSIRAPPSQV
jgi:hypothetical protein